MAAPTPKILAIVAAFMAATIPTETPALTCHPTTLRTQLEAFFAAGERLTVLAGFIGKERWGAKTDPPNVLDLSDSVEKDPDAPPPVARLKLYGVVIDSDGSIRLGRRKVQIEEHCGQTWCGSAPDGPGPRLFVLTDRDGVLTGAVGPCGGTVFPMPSLAQLRAIRACIANKRCGPGADSLEDLSAKR